MTQTAKISYMHYRRRDAFGTVTDPRGGATVAIKTENGSTSFSIAWCGKKEVFNRKIGRAVATGRLPTTPYPVLATIDLESDRDVVATLIAAKMSEMKYS